MIEKEEFFEEISKQLEFDINDYVDVEDIETFDELYDELDNQGAFEREVIYYYNAIEYLKENDASLRESMELAYHHGVGTNEICSELLASLLKSQKCREEFAELRSEIEFYLEDIK